MKQHNTNPEEQKSDERKSAELKFGSNFLILISHFAEFVNYIIDKQIEQKLKEKLAVEEENKIPVYYTIAEVCEILKVTKTSLYNYTHKKGWLKFKKIGKRVLFARQDVIDALESFKKYERNPQ
jgi:excisionase family DNA binding protein